MRLARAMTAELVGTALLLTLIVGSGRQVADLGVDPVAQLLAHAVAVGLGLAVLVAVFLPVSGSQFNPAVTLAVWLRGGIASGTALGHVAAQLAGAVAGVVVADLTFGAPALTVATTARPGVVGAEALATFSLVLAILALVAADRPGWLPAAVGGIVAAGIVATASTGFANPAVTVARGLTDSWAGIAPGSVPGFVAAQVVGALAAAGAVRWWWPDAPAG